MEEGSVNNNLEELFLIQRKDTKLTLRHLPGPFSVTNGTNTKAYSYASQTFTMKLFVKLVNGSQQLMLEWGSECVFAAVSDEHQYQYGMKDFH